MLRLVSSPFVNFFCFLLVCFLRKIVKPTFSQGFSRDHQEMSAVNITLSPVVRMRSLLPTPQGTAPSHQASLAEPERGTFHHMLFYPQHQNNSWWSSSGDWVVAPDQLSYSWFLCSVLQTDNLLCLHHLLQLLSSESGVLFLEGDLFFSANVVLQQAKIFLCEFFF